MERTHGKEGLTRLEKAFLALALIVMVSVVGLRLFHAPSEIQWGAEGLLGVTSSLFLWQSATRRATCISSAHLSCIGWRFIGWFALLWGFGAVFEVAGRFLSGYGNFPLTSAVQLLSYLPLFIGLGSLAAASSSRARVQLLMDSLVASAAIAALSWNYVIAPVWMQATGQFESRLTTIGFPIGETVASFAALVLFFGSFSHRELRRSICLIGAGAIFSAVGAAIYSAGTSISVAGIEGQWCYDAWGFAHLLLGVAAVAWVNPDQARTEASEELRSRTFGFHSVISLLGPYAIGFGAFLFIAARELHQHHAVRGGTLWTGGAITALVLIRQVMTMMDNHRLGRRVAQFNSDLESVVEKRTAQIQSLYVLAKAVGNSLDVDEVLKNSSSHALDALHGDAIVVNLTPFAFMGHSKITDMVRHIGLENNYWVLDKLNILETPWCGSSGIVHDEEFRRHAKYVTAPIVCKGNALGWVSVIRWGMPFDKTDVRMLEGIGTEVGTALENARLFEMAKQMADIDPVTGLLNHRATQERFEFVFKVAEDTYEPMCLLMIDLDNFKYFNDTYGHLAGDHILKAVSKILRDLARPHDIVGRYGGDEFVMLLPNTHPSEAEEISHRIRLAVAEGGYPEPGTDRVIPFGVSIGYAGFPEHAKTRHELLYQADHGMYRSKKANAGGANRPSVRKPTQQTGDSFDLLDSMVNAVDNKDYYTRAHSEEVAEYAAWIVQELKLSDGAQKIVRTAALLHDVGKIGIPDEILRKPGHLSDEEFEVMRQHPVVGAMIVASMPGMTDILPGVRFHHERWDGKGYPEGLKGDDIPLLGRILAVPDAFSAMTTDRPYRKGMNWHVAIDKIRGGIGTQFDPSIAAAFLRAIEKRRSSLPRLSEPNPEQAA